MQNWIATCCALAFAYACAAACVEDGQPPAPKIDLSQLRQRDALVLMRANNRELKAARRQVEGAQADVIVAGARPNPTLSVNSSSYSPSRGIGGGAWKDKALDTVLRVDQVIERGDKRALRLAAAGERERASTADLAEVLRQQTLAIRTAYFDLLLQQEKTRVSTENAVLFDQTLQAAKLRLRAGDLSAADAARIEVDALRAKNDARAAEADRVRAQFTLALLLGVEGDAARVRASDAWPEAAEAREIDDAAGALEARPDIQAAHARLAAAQAGRELARSMKTRDVTVGVQYERAPSDAGLGNASTYGIGASVPLFLGYGYEGEIRRAEVEWDSAREALERARAQAASDVAKSRADLRAATERVRRNEDELLPQARRSADAAEYAFRKGALAVMDLLDARRTLQSTQIETVNARADHAKALAAWQASIGQQENTP